MSDAGLPFGVDRPGQAWDWMQQTAQAPGSYDWVRPEVAEAWERCLEDHALQLGVELPPACTRSEESDHGSRPWPLELQTTLFVQAFGVHAFLQDADAIVVLADAQCRLMHVVGAGSRLCPEASHLLKLGANWREASVGNNGVGTAAVVGAPIAFLGKEHFFHKFHACISAGYPIRGPDGEMLAVLGLVSTQRDSLKSSLAFVRMAGMLVEAEVFNRHRPPGRLLRFRPADAREGLKAQQGGIDGLIVMGDDGHILALNATALGLLGAERHAEIVGQPLDATLGVGIDRLSRALAGGALAIEAVSASGTRLQVEVEPAVRARTDAPASRAGARSTNDRGSGTTDGSAAPETSAIGGDAIMDSLLRKTVRLLERKIPVLVIGESGVGKEHLVQLAHRSGPRCDAPLIAINCAAIPRDLVESELFGYEAGSFTGAAKDGRPGKFLQANGGTLFLDEIGDMKLELQATLLRVLESSEFVPVGGVKPVKVDVQVIAATNACLRDCVERGGFRRDLYYRLNGAQVWIPSLRERPDKVQLINTIFEQELEQAGYAPSEKALRDDLIEIFLTHPWPGNVRQLRNVLKTSVLMSRDGLVCPDDLPPDFLDERSDSGRAAEAGASGQRQLRGDTAGPLPVSGVTNGVLRDDVHLPGGAMALTDWEHHAVLTALSGCGWNVSHAARRLGITRGTLYQKITKYGIRKPHRSW